MTDPHLTQAMSAYLFGNSILAMFITLDVLNLWWPKRDLNPHPLRDRFLRPARLPIPPFGHALNLLKTR